MENLRLTRNLFYFVFLIGILHTVYFYFEMPNEIASHFDAGGTADAFSDKDILLYLNIPIYLFILLFFEIIVFFVPRVPDKLINLPNKEYWLTPERRQEAYTILKVNSRWLGIITILLLLTAFHENYRANISGEFEIGISFWFYLGVYLILTVVIILRMNSKFKNP